MYSLAGTGLAKENRVNVVVTLFFIVLESVCAVLEPALTCNEVEYSADETNEPINSVEEVSYWHDFNDTCSA